MIYVFEIVYDFYKGSYDIENENYHVPSKSNWNPINLADRMLNIINQTNQMKTLNMWPNMNIYILDQN